MSNYQEGVSTLTHYKINDGASLKSKFCVGSLNWIAFKLHTNLKRLTIIKDHAYLHKPPTKSYGFLSAHDLLLPPDSKGLKDCWNYWDTITGSPSISFESKVKIQLTVGGASLMRSFK